MSVHSASAGSTFLFSPASPDHVLIPERLSDDDRAIARTVDEFWETDVAPLVPALHRREPHVARQLLRKAADLGLTAIQVPADHGGLDLGLPALMLTIEHLARDASYLGWHLGHSGIGLLPLLHYGTDAQKATYLGRMVSGELIGAYALSEPGAGTDALAIRTRADLTADGRAYRLNGQKMWITNGGDADLFTVFAKVDGEAFTAFLVERAFGVRSGSEEHKMGLAGTSTTALYFDDVLVPVENVLGAIGEGHRIAFNVLNAGRLELGPNMVGAAREVLAVSLAHAASRRAFGQRLADFGAIQQMVGDCVTRIFAAESATWRAVGLVDDEVTRRRANGDHRAAAEIAAFDAFAAECSIVKVLSSEMLDAVVDHGVQVHGGYGYHRDYYVERAYRDARINRIFEGTNEVNRLIVPSLVVKRAARAGLDAIDEASRLVDRLDELAALPPARDDETIGARAATVAQLVLSAAHRETGGALREPQAIVMRLADTMIETFAMQSVLVRRQALAGTAQASAAADACAVYVRDALPRVERAAAEALAATASAPPAVHAAVRALTAMAPDDVIARRRRLAEAALGAGRYVFGTR